MIHMFTSKKGVFGMKYMKLPESRVIICYLWIMLYDDNLFIVNQYRSHSRGLYSNLTRVKQVSMNVLFPSICLNMIELIKL